MHEPSRFRHGGLRVLHDPVPGPLTAVAVVIAAGSRCDGRHPGLAHMAEHMLFQGTRRLDQVAINRRAGELGGEHDADTSYDDMAVHFEVFNEDVAEALALLAEQLFASAVPADRFAKERRVVIDEIRGRQEDPAGALYEQAWRRFLGDGFGHPIAGSIASLRAMRPEHVRRFLARRFVPATMVLCASGGVRRADFARAVARTFPRRSPPDPGLGAPPRVARTGLATFRRADLTQTYVVRLAHVASDVRARLALSLALEIVGADPDARLFQEIRERLGLGYDVGASLESGADWAVTVLSASAAREHAQRLLDSLDRTCRAAADGFSDAEFDRARRKLRYRLARLGDSRLDRALTHATRAALGQPSLRETTRLLDGLRRPDVETAWRGTLEAPTLTAVLSS